jgi:FKBP-type peptidyl-prolyl cis-trans isomerase
MKLLRVLGLLAVSITFMTFVPGCADDEESDAKELKVYTPKGQVVMRYLDLVEGKGEPVKKMDAIQVHYTGTLTSGTKFDSSRDSGKPFALVIGAGKVIQGWDEGIIGMKVGGKRKLWIPPELGYGDQKAGKIPPNSKLIFEVELIKILDAEEWEAIQRAQMIEQLRQQQQRGF